MLTLRVHLRPFLLSSPPFYRLTCLLPSFLLNFPQNAYLAPPPSPVAVSLVILFPVTRGDCPYCTAHNLLAEAQVGIRSLYWFSVAVAMRVPSWMHHEYEADDVAASFTVTG